MHASCCKAYLAFSLSARKQLWDSSPISTCILYYKWGRKRICVSLPLYAFWENATHKILDKKKVYICMYEWRLVIHVHGSYFSKFCETSSLLPINLEQINACKRNGHVEDAWNNVTFGCFLPLFLELWNTNSGIMHED